MHSLLAVGFELRIQENCLLTNILGGPGVMSVGWIVVSFFTLLVAIAMAEIVSAIPTSGGPYFWAALLAPPRWSPFAAWLTGWFNLLGQVAVTTGISFGTSVSLGTINVLAVPRIVLLSVRVNKFIHLGFSQRTNASSQVWLASSPSQPKSRTRISKEPRRKPSEFTQRCWSLMLW